MADRYKLFWLVIFSMILINSFSFLFAQSSGITEKEIKDIARVESVNFLNDIPAGQEVLYGFDNRGQFKYVTIGRPVQIVSLSAESFPVGANNVDLKIVPTEEWFVPLIVGKTIKAIITVAKHQGKYQAVDFGAKDLAQELNSFPDITDESNNVISILRVYRLQSDFLITSQNNKPEQKVIIPLKSAQTALLNDVSCKSRLTEKETLYLLKDKLVLLSTEEKN
jgi:hypothetical protein